MIITNLGWKSVWSASTFISAKTMLILCIVGVERGVIMKKLTLEEAVKVLEDMKVKIAIPKAAELQHKKNEAIDMAIEALSSSEIPNSSDMVSRKTVLDALENELRYGACVDYCGLDTAIDIVTELPSAEPQERKTGQWLWYDGVRCSNCNYKLQTTGLPTVCPNCGSYNGGVCG